VTIGGAANAITAALVAPESFNFGEGIDKLGAMAVGGALLAAAMYLKKVRYQNNRMKQLFWEGESP